MNHFIQNIDSLPSIHELKKISQGLALIDAIIMPEWEYRYFSFNNNWDGNQREMMASMRDGSGSEYFIHFTDAGVAGKVFYEDTLADVSYFLNIIPNSFSSFKNEAAFSVNNATFFFWREESTATWVAAPVNLKTYPLLGFLVKGIEGYHHWAEAYYEKAIDSHVLKDVFSSLAITADQLAILNPDLMLADLEEDFQEIL